MKNVMTKFRPIILIFLGIIIISGCSKRNHDDEKPTGKLSLMVGMSVSSHDVYSNLKAANTGDFKVIIYNSDDAVAASYDKASEMPDAIDLPEGKYYVIASFGTNPAAEFEQPYYYGISSEIEILGGQSSIANVTCYISNILVSIVYSDNVKTGFNDYSTSVSNIAGTLQFFKNETRTGYFNNGPLYIEANLYFTNSNGELQTKKLSGTINNPEPRKHYEVHIDATQADGSAAIQLVADETVETEIVEIVENPVFGQVDYGKFIITEIMYNPTALDDATGEYIEVYNVSDSTLNLKGLIIRRASGSIHTIASDVIVAPHQYAVLARSETAAPIVNYVYSSIALTNTADEIIINKYGTNGSDGTVICSVAYSSALGFPSSVSDGSIQLDNSAFDVEAAKLGTNWCKSSVTFSTGDMGTPGTNNSSCN